MKPSLRFLLLGSSLALLVLADAGCTAKARAGRHLAKANQYLERHDYEKAEIEYLNVLQLDPMNAQAIAGLGIEYFDEGRRGIVFTYLSKARELLPNDLRVRNRLGELYISAGKPKEARAEAWFVLQKAPQDPEAPLTLAQSATDAAGVAEVRRQLGSLPSAVAQSAPVLSALGLLDLRENHVPAAEAKFNEALRVDPKSAPAHLGLAGIYQMHKDAAAAEKAFAAAAQDSPPGAGVKIQYAGFEVQQGHPDQARRILEEMIRTAPFALSAYLSLAQLDADQQKVDDALARVTKVLAKDPIHPDALSFSARLHLAKGQYDKALADIDRAIQTYPQAPQFQLQRAAILTATGDLNGAAGACNEALRLDPNLPAATLTLADVNVRQGRLGNAAALLKALALKYPRALQVHLALANVYARQGNLDGALGIYRQVAKAFPQDAQVALQIGLLLAQQNKTAEARDELERALKLEPNLLAALEQIAAIEIKQKHFAAAKERVNAELARNPKAAGAYLVLAKICTAAGETKEAEAALQKVIALQPDQAIGYMLLGQLYIQSHQEDKAIANLLEATKNAPKDPQPPMILAVIYDEQKKYAQARDYYEKALAINPRFAAALNNLAYVDSEYLNDLNRAFDLARQARDLNPNEPHTADTLGWVLFKRRQYPWALSLLSESAERLPTSPDVQFHLGMANYMLDNEQPARAALTQAIKLNDSFRGIEDARRALQILDTDPATADDATVARLAKVATDDSDPVAYTRLGAIYERRGQADKAQAAYEAAQKQSPNSLKPLLGLVRLNQAAGQTGKALELAKAARKLSPTDPEVALVLGQLAFGTGDYPWAASLLHEAAQALPDDAAANVAYAEAAYANGDADEATNALRAAESDTGNAAMVARARQLQQLIELAATPDPKREPLAREALKNAPNSIPAGMAVARLEETSNPAGATAAYQDLLKRDPAFTPALARLVQLYARDPKSAPPTVMSLVTKARAAFPDDPAVGRACGLIAYAKADYAQAASLLARFAKEPAGDSTVLFYLGMSQYRLNKKADSKRNLQAFVGTQGDPELVAEAKRTLQQIP